MKRRRGTCCSGPDVGESLTSKDCRFNTHLCSDVVRDCLCDHAAPSCGGQRGLARRLLDPAESRFLLNASPLTMTKSSKDAVAQVRIKCIRQNGCQLAQQRPYPHTYNTIRLVRCAQQGSHREASTIKQRNLPILCDGLKSRQSIPL